MCESEQGTGSESEQGTGPGELRLDPDASSPLCVPPPPATSRSTSLDSSRCQQARWPQKGSRGPQADPLHPGKSQSQASGTLPRGAATPGPWLSPSSAAHSPGSRGLPGPVTSRLDLVPLPLLSAGPPAPQAGLLQALSPPALSLPPQPNSPAERLGRLLLGVSVSLPVKWAVFAQAALTNYHRLVA